MVLGTASKKKLKMITPNRFNVVHLPSSAENYADRRRPAEAGLR